MLSLNNLDKLLNNLVEEMDGELTMFADDLRLFNIKRFQLTEESSHGTV